MKTFVTESTLPIEAALTMGVSVKPEDSIGRFGTGLKYAIAGILRLGGEIEINCGKDRYRFGTLNMTIRGKGFKIVTCNAAKCGFTTEVGKHWEPWMLFRELASNTLDEGGGWVDGMGVPGSPGTRITIVCPEVEAAEKAGEVFLDPSRKCILRSSNGATLYEGESLHYYYKGIRAGSWADGIAPVTVDIYDGVLTEDRTLDTYVAKRELTYAFLTATEFDPAAVRAFALVPKDGFFGQNTTLAPKGMPTDRIVEAIIESERAIKIPLFRSLIEDYKERKGVERFDKLPWTRLMAEYVGDAEKVCRAAGVDVPDPHKVFLTDSLNFGTLGNTNISTGEVYISTKAIMIGRNEFIRTYLEEAVHAMTGLQDETRALQDLLFAMIVKLAGE